MLIALGELKYQTLRAALAEPEALNGCLAWRAIPARHRKELAATQVEKGFLAIGICTL
jgi:hypothetical protein